MREAELIIDYCDRQSLLSTIAILFLNDGSELFVADLKGFPLKMIFTSAEDIDIVTLLVILLGLICQQIGHFC